MTSQENEPSEPDVPLILIADDDVQIRQMLRAFLDTQNCNIIEASDGAEALESVLVHKPNLVILDVMMPELNGWQVCKYVKSKEELQGVGIIMLTAIGPVNNELTSPIFGADDYVDKPFDLEELSTKINQVLESKRHSSSSESETSEE